MKTDIVTYNGAVKLEEKLKVDREPGKIKQ